MGITAFLRCPIRRSASFCRWRQWPSCAEGQPVWSWRTHADDFVLELAVKAQAAIVTWNAADFKKASTLGITVVDPRTFLQQLEKQP